MNVPGSLHTREIGRQYDLFQTSLEALDNRRKFLNYGYTVSRKQTYEERQERLCIEVFNAAEIDEGSVLVDVGFGSGEQDLLLSRMVEFERLIGFNVSERQVQYAARRAKEENRARKLFFRLGEAELLPGIEEASVDRILAIECAHYFDRPRFYRRAALVLKPGGLVVLADISFSRHLAFLTRKAERFRRVGTRSSNKMEWERFLTTRSQRNVNAATWPGAQMTVFKILGIASFRGLSGAERREWLKLAFFSQLITFGLMIGLVHYDLIVLANTSLAIPTYPLERSSLLDE